VVELQLRAGRPEAMLAHVLTLLDRPGLEECDVTTLLPLLAQACLGLDEVGESRVQSGRALTRARREGMRPVLVEASRVEVAIAMREHRWEDARRSVSEGLTLARDIGFPYGEAGLLRTGLPLWEMPGDGTAAQEQQQQAEDIFRGLGAAGDLPARGGPSRASIAPPPPVDARSCADEWVTPGMDRASGRGGTEAARRYMGWRSDPPRVQ